MISVLSLFTLGLFAVMFDVHPGFRKQWLNLVGGALVMIALIIGATGEFVPVGLTSLISGFVLFAVGMFVHPRKARLR